MNQRVLLLMSGGVDSSVAAVLLQRQDFEVVGITMNQIDSIPVDESDACCSRQAILDARAVADKLGIEHYAVNTMKQFGEQVIEPFIQSYKDGLTPNPCVYCNSFVRFEEAFELAQEHNCSYVATGHYAQLIHDGNNTPRMHRAKFREKDQSYFLYGIRRELLKQIRFPLGEITKEEVRAIAHELNLATADKAESQEICFTAGRSYNEFLAQYVEDSEGPILDLQGEQLGTHPGVIHYTVGQRKGIGLTGGPFFVCKIDVKNNSIIIGKKEDLAVSEVSAFSPRWINAPEVGDQVSGQLRSRHTSSPAIVTRIDEDGFTVIFDKPQYGVAPGQALVLSVGDEILGGGTISP